MKANILSNSCLYWLIIASNNACHSELVGITHIKRHSKNESHQLKHLSFIIDESILQNRVIYVQVISYFSIVLWM